MPRKAQQLDWTEEGEVEWIRIDHLAGHHSLRHLGRGWVLKLRLLRSVPGRGLGLAVWGQPERLRSTVPPAGERGVLRVGGWAAPAEGSREKVWPCRGSKAPLLGRGEEEGQAPQETLCAGAQALRGRGTCGPGYRWREAAWPGRRIWAS